MNVEEKEKEALLNVNTKRKLLKRFKEAYSLLKDEYQKEFELKEENVNLEKKYLKGKNGMYMIWCLREYPNLEESYINQQTTKGIVNLIKIKE